MGLFSKITKAGVAKKVVDEARKPENQRKIKSAISSFRNKDKGNPGGRGEPGGTRPV